MMYHSEVWCYVDCSRFVVGDATGYVVWGVCCGFWRGYVKAAFFKPDWVQLPVSREYRHLFDRRVGPGASFQDMGNEVSLVGERQRHRLAKRGEGGRRD